MTILKIDATGALALDEVLLDHLGVKPGQEIEAELDVGGKLVLKAKANTQARTGRIEDTFGMLSQYYDGPSLSTEELNEAIADAAAVRRQ